MQSILRIVAAATMTVALGAQARRFVGPGGHPDIQSAIAASSAGDVIEIAGGQYPPFAVDRAVTLTAATGAIVDVQANTFAGGGVAFSARTGSTRVRGLRFRNPTPFSNPCSVSVFRSIVAFEDCSFEAHSHDPSGALVAREAAVSFMRCLLVGSGGPFNNVGYTNSAAAGNALQAVASWITAVDSTFVAGLQHWDSPGDPGHGVLCDRSALHMVRCLAMGGTNSPITCRGHPAGDGVRVQGPTFQVSIADSTLLGGNGHCGLGGHGLRNLGTVPVLLERTVATGGFGSVLGQGFVGMTVPAPLLGLAATVPPLVPGNAWSVDYLAVPGTVLLPAVSFELAPYLDVQAAQRVWLPAASSPLSPIVADAGGRATVAFVVPATAALRGSAAWLHAFAGGGALVQCAPPLGGVVW